MLQVSERDGTYRHVHPRKLSITTPDGSSYHVLENGRAWRLDRIQLVRGRFESEHSVGSFSSEQAAELKARSLLALTEGEL